MVLEESENLGNERIMTIRSSRGEEFVINSDKLATSFVEFISELRNERRFGWTLNTPWFEQWFERMQHDALKQGDADDGR